MPTKRSKASYKKAAAKGLRTRRKNLGKTTTRSRTTTKSTTRRRKAPAKKGMLSELFNPKMAEGAFKAMGSGAMGAVVCMGVDKLMVNQTPLVKNLTTGALAFAAATLGKAPNFAAGLASVSLYKAMDAAGLLADDLNLQDHNYAGSIEALPMVLDDNGDTMYLEQEGDNIYLQDEGELDYNVGYFPAGFGY